MDLLCLEAKDVVQTFIDKARPVPSKTVMDTALYSQQQGIEFHSLGSVSRGARCSLG